MKGKGFQSCGLEVQSSIEYSCVDSKMILFIRGAALLLLHDSSSNSTIFRLIQEPGDCGSKARPRSRTGPGKKQQKQLKQSTLGIRGRND